MQKIVIQKTKRVEPKFMGNKEVLKEFRHVKVKESFISFENSYFDKFLFI